jgi:glyoxylase-like metal-dependent hydrolase (beta-lactamase superfamily II)
VTAEKVADGVWFIAGGSHNSVAIEMKDHLVLVEAPLNDGRTAPVIDEVKKLAPASRSATSINSHSHFDHSGGLRAAAPRARRSSRRPATRRTSRRRSREEHDRPGPLREVRKEGEVLGVQDKLNLTDGTRTLEIRRIAAARTATRS